MLIYFTPEKLATLKRAVSDSIMDCANMARECMASQCRAQEDRDIAAARGAEFDDILAYLESQTTPKTWTVISIDEDGRIASDPVEAKDDQAAFLAVCAARADQGSCDLVCAIRGDIREGSGINFPGESVVDAGQYIENHGPEADA